MASNLGAFCEQLLKIANTSAKAGVFYTCMCQNGDESAPRDEVAHQLCLRLEKSAGISDLEETAEPSSGDFVMRSVYPLSGVAVFFLLGIVCMMKAYRNRRQLDTAHRAEHGNVVDTRGHSGNIVTSPNRRGHTLRSHPPRPEDDPPPPYSSIHCEAPPSYEKVVGSSKPATATATATAAAAAAATATATAAALSASSSDSIV